MTSSIKKIVAFKALCATEYPSSPKTDRVKIIKPIPSKTRRTLSLRQNICLPVNLWLQINALEGNPFPEHLFAPEIQDKILDIDHAYTSYLAVTASPKQTYMDAKFLSDRGYKENRTETTFSPEFLVENLKRLPRGLMTVIMADAASAHCFSTQTQKPYAIIDIDPVNNLLTTSYDDSKTYIDGLLSTVKTFADQPILQLLWLTRT